MTFRDWQAQQNQDSASTTESRQSELGYQITHLRLLRGMSQAELADKSGARQLLIARLENGSSMPDLSFLERIAEALDAQVEIRIRSRTAHP